MTSTPHTKPQLKNLVIDAFTLSWSEMLTDELTSRLKIVNDHFNSHSRDGLGAGDRNRAIVAQMQYHGSWSGWSVPETIKFISNEMVEHVRQVEAREAERAEKIGRTADKVRAIHANAKAAK